MNLKERTETLHTSTFIMSSLRVPTRYFGHEQLLLENKEEHGGDHSDEGIANVLEL